MSFAVTWMDLETVIQSEISQKVKNKYHVNKHMLKNGTGGPICKAEMETQTAKTNVWVTKVVGQI